MAKNEIVLSSVKHTVMHTFDENTKKYTLFLLERGGPLVIADTLEEGKLKMEDALKVAIQVRNLVYYDDITDIKRNDYLRSNTSTKESVKYQELVLA